MHENDNVELQPVECERLYEHEGLISSRTEDLLCFVRKLTSKDAETVDGAARFFEIDNPQYNPLISQIYTEKYPDSATENNLPARILAKDIEAMNSLRIAASHRFTPEVSALGSSYTCFDGEYINEIINGRLRAGSAQKDSREYEYLREGMSKPARLIAAIVTPLRTPQDVASTPEDRVSMLLNMQGFLGLTDDELHFCYAQTDVVLEKRAEKVRAYLNDLNAIG